MNNTVCRAVDDYLIFWYPDILFIIPVLGADYDYSGCSEAQPRKKRLFVQQNI